MHMKRWLALLLIAAVLLASGCTAVRQDQLYLYGEFHANDELLQRELALWKDYYAGGMRDLFVELPYYTAQYLNRWMQADNDRILMEVYADWKGSASYHQNVLDFYRGIKAACPETVFHGTDVGHQYNSTGYRYLRLHICRKTRIRKRLYISASHFTLSYNSYPVIALNKLTAHLKKLCCY